MAEKKRSGLRVIDGGGGPPDMEARLRHLESDMAIVKETMATREDLQSLRVEMHSLLRQQIMWSVGTIIATASLVFAIVRFAG